MPDIEPAAELEPRFSSDDATATPWSVAYEQLEQAQVYWLSTVRPDGRPHVTPLIAAWLDGALYFCTGPAERKAKNLAQNPHVVVTTGSSAMQGLDVVLEGEAVPFHDEPTLQRLADLIATKYNGFWTFTVQDGAFYGDGGRAVVYAVAPSTVFGFAKGDTFSQTRWRF
jgi:nitroimidazol reductase NimA-like FMN-containing flavoprotein (pyridoxamine 5'-phosphate oxidase superfamily)